MKTKLVAIMLSIGCFSANAGDVYIWKGGPSNGGELNNPEKWDRKACPGPGDTAQFQVAEVVVANDNDAALLASVGRIYTQCWTETYRATLVCDFSTNVTFNCPVQGGGRFIKRGAGTLEFASTDRSNAVSAYSSYGVYNVSGDGFWVENGTLVLAQGSDFDYYYSTIKVNDGATLIVSSNRTTVVGSLFGAGEIKQLGNTTRTFQIGKTDLADFPSHYQGVFSGKLTGKMDLDIRGNADISGTENDFTGSVSITYGRKNSKGGRARFASFGSSSSGRASSAGAGTAQILIRYGAQIGYLGTGEASDRNFCWSLERSGTGSAIEEQYFDAGAYGGLTLSGIFKLDNYGSEYNMRPFVFTGSNTAPCTISGPFHMNYTCPTDKINYNYYIRKEGTGTWNFQENAASTFKGVFDVREGVLGFDSIAETNVNCALGLATMLSDEFTGTWDESHRSRYALRAGVQAADANAVLEFNGSESCSSTTRPLLLTGDAHFRANGTSGAAIDFSDVSASSGATAKTLTLDGTSTVANVMREIDDGDGKVSLVKDGAGTWVLDGNQTFTGDLTIKAGTLRVRGSEPYRYFRVTFTNDDPDNDHQYGAYVAEFGLYDKNGNRLNKNLSFQRPSGWVDGTTYYTLASGQAKNLSAGCMTFDRIEGFSGGTQYCKADSDDGALIHLCDGIYNRVDFVYPFKSQPSTIAMRLADDCAEVAYVDYCARYDASGHQNANGFRLEASLNGSDWTIVAETNSLPYASSTSTCWYFSDSHTKVNDAPNARTLGNGEGMALTTRATELKNQLAGVNVYSVAAGAELIAEGADAPVISKLVIDGENGAGKISGFVFADNITIDIRTTGALRATKLPADFTGIANFDEVTPTITLNGEPQNWRHKAKVCKDKIVISGLGGIIIVR